LAQFRTREEYERWKAAQESGAAAPVKDAAAAPATGFSVAKRKPKLGLVIAGAAVMICSSGFLFATGDRFSGTFVLALGVMILGLYAYFKLRPQLDDVAYLRTAAAAVAQTALRHGHVSKADAEAVKRAEEMARERHAKEAAPSSKATPT
jgi:uncharacterized membrane protein